MRWWDSERKWSKKLDYRNEFVEAERRDTVRNLVKDKGDGLEKVHPHSNGKAHGRGPMSRDGRMEMEGG